MKIMSANTRIRGELPAFSVVSRSYDVIEDVGVAATVDVAVRVVFGCICSA
jgi:hypothetical protein